MTAEEWRPVPGFPGYEASSNGRVLSRRQSSKGRILRGLVDGHGYPAVGLYRDGKLHIWRRHRVIAATFLGPRPVGLQTRHLNGDKFNCSVANLAYGTGSENVRDQLRHGTHHLANRTSCHRGHPFDDENTYRDVSGRRQCRACKRLWETDRAAFAATQAYPRRSRAAS